MSLQGSLSIERMCQLAQVNRAGFFRSLQKRVAVEEEMEVRSTIQQIVLEHRRRYGYRRVSTTGGVRAATKFCCNVRCRDDGFFRHGEDYRPDRVLSKTRSGPQAAPLTIGFDESPAGYSLTSCSPAEFASASPANGDFERTARV